MPVSDASHAGLDAQDVASFRSISVRSGSHSPEYADATHANVSTGDFGAASDSKGVRVTWESGLPCRWNGPAPIAPEPSFRRSANLAAKRVCDVILSGLALVVLAPLLIVIALTIKMTDRGPVFFRQFRVGRDGKPFLIYKFRSMYADKCDHTGVAQTVFGDDRVMPIGVVLRRTSLDELPQLINVLIGDMSLVGPRPQVEGQLAARAPYDQVVRYYHHRNVMLPGITGWAQANGLRGPTDDVVKAKARIDHDIAYIQNFSFMLDLRIIFRTLVREFFSGTGV